MTRNKMMDHVHVHMDASVQEMGKVYVMPAIALSTRTKKPCAGVEVVTTNPNSPFKAVATSCGAGLTASVCRMATPASCWPVREGTLTW
jgi:hypothetical protein